MLLRRFNIKILINSLIICIFLCIVLLLPKTMDKVFLLEKRAPTYWEAIGSKNPYSIMALPEYSDIYKRNVIFDNELNNYRWTEGNIAGVNVIKENDNLILNGTVSDTVYLGVTEEDRIRLTEGVYYISTGIPEFAVYFEGWKDGEHYVISNGLGTDLIRIRAGEYPEGFRLVMFLKEGKSYDEASVAPKIIKISDDPDASIETARANVWEANRSEWDRFTLKEKHIAQNRLLNVSDGNALWASIFFDDGTGIQYVDGKFLEGNINCFGVVCQD